MDGGIWLVFIIPGLLIHYFLSINIFINKAPYLVYMGVIFGAVLSIYNTINVINGKSYKRFNIINRIKDKQDSK